MFSIGYKQIAIFIIYNIQEKRPIPNRQSKKRRRNKSIQEDFYFFEKERGINETSEVLFGYSQAKHKNGLAILSTKDGEEIYDDVD